MSQAKAFMTSISRYISLVTQPEQLRTAVEMLAFTHVPLGWPGANCHRPIYYR